MIRYLYFLLFICTIIHFTTGYAVSGDIKPTDNLDHLSLINCEDAWDISTGGVA